MSFIPIGKHKTRISKFSFTEADLEKIHYLMTNYKVHEISMNPGYRNHSSNLFPLNLFKTKTNVLACRRCNHITLNKKNQSEHNCIYHQQEEIIQENHLGPDRIQDDDDNSTQSSNSSSPRKRQCHDDLSSGHPPHENEQSSSSYRKCSNAFYLEHNNLSMRIECNEIATPQHKFSCAARFGSGHLSEDWIEMSHNRVMFLHTVFGFSMSPKMHGDFATVYNTALGKMASDNEWQVETCKSVSNVRITKCHDGESLLISTARGTRIISSECGDIRELAGDTVSRRQFEQKLKILRKMNFKVPKNMRRSLATSREQIRNYSQIVEYSNFGSSVANDWSALICFSRDGLEEYLNQLIMESTAFDHCNSITIAIDAGTVSKCYFNR